MKNISLESEKKLDTIFNLLSQVDVKGENVFRMATALSLLQEISNQINTPPEEGDDENKEE